MKKRRLFALLLTLVMTLSLAACGAKEETPAQSAEETPAECNITTAPRLVLVATWMNG